MESMRFERQVILEALTAQEAMAMASNEFYAEVNKWCRTFSSKLSLENHYLQVGHVRIAHSPRHTAYERAADLMLRDKPADKVLLKDAVLFRAVWHNS